MAEQVHGALVACAATLLCGVLAAGPAIAETSWQIVPEENLGLAPFEAALGALRVAEEMLFRYRIVARESRGPVADRAPADPAADP